MTARLYSMFLLLAALSGCDKAPVPPATSGSDYSGVAYIGCALSPYAFNIDSLILHCQSAFDLTQEIDSIIPGCSLDAHGEILGAMPDVVLSRTAFGMDLTSVSGDPIITLVNIDLMGSELVAEDYPYLGGYRIEWTDRLIEIRVVNKWIGGCFHDLVLWNAHLE